MDADDATLLRRIQEGDGESLGLLYDLTRGFLLDVVIRPRVGRADAEDVLSETFRTALDKIGAFEWRGVGVVRWLAAIARRKALERVRQRGRETIAAGDVLDALDGIPDGAPGAEAETIRVERLRLLRGRVEETLGALPPRYAEALRLRLLEGRDRASCAERLALSVGAFDVLLHRATRAFASRWRPM